MGVHTYKILYNESIKKLLIFQIHFTNRGRGRLRRWRLHLDVKTRNPQLEQQIAKRSRQKANGNAGKAVTPGKN